MDMTWLVPMPWYGLLVDITLPSPAKSKVQNLTDNVSKYAASIGLNKNTEVMIITSKTF